MKIKEDYKMINNKLQYLKKKWEENMIFYS